MTITAGRPTRNESLEPPKVFTALALVATGTSFEKAAETVSMTGKALRKWRSHKDVKDYLEEIPRENIDIGTNLLASRNHLYMKKLDEIIMNPQRNNKVLYLIPISLSILFSYIFLRKTLIQT